MRIRLVRIANQSVLERKANVLFQNAFFVSVRKNGQKNVRKKNKREDLGTLIEKNGRFFEKMREKINLAQALLY